MRFATLALGVLFAIGGAFAHTNVAGVINLPPLILKTGRMPLQYGPTPVPSPVPSPAPTTVPSPSASPAVPSPSTPSSPSSPSATPSPGRSPTPAPTPSPGQSTCSFKGTYKLVNDARKACPAKKSDYVVYNGGSTTGCKNSTILLRPSGKFNSKRSRWTLATVGGSTTIITAGRECSDGEKGMQPAGTTVVLGAKTTKWQIVPAGGSCSSVYIKRISSGSAFLSAPTKCTAQKLIFASKDYGTGRQRWRLVKV